MCQKRPLNKFTVYTKNMYKKQCNIQWLQIIYSVKWTSTQKQITRKNEKFNLLSANKVSVIACVKKRAHFPKVWLGYLNPSIRPSNIQHYSDGEPATRGPNAARVDIWYGP